MSLKLKVLGLALVASFAISAVAVLNATAETGGHFFATGAGAATTTLTGGDIQTGGALPHFIDLTLGTTFSCTNVAYTGEVTGETQTEVAINPTYEQCYSGTHTNDANTTHVTKNGCFYVFTINKEPETKDSTVHLSCPAGKSVVIHTTNLACTITIHPQTPSGGITYTTGGSGNTHDITVDFSLKLKVTRHNNFCMFVSTDAEVELTGRATIKGFRGGIQVPITATEL